MNFQKMTVKQVIEKLIESLQFLVGQRVEKFGDLHNTVKKFIKDDFGSHNLSYETWGVEFKGDGGFYYKVFTLKLDFEDDNREWLSQAKFAERTGKILGLSFIPTADISDCPNITFQLYVCRVSVADQREEIEKELERQNSRSISLDKTKVELEAKIVENEKKYLQTAE